MSTIGSISFGTALVAGKNRVPRPAAGITAFRTFRCEAVMRGTLASARMAEDRPFPPSPRRRSLAARAGVTAASPLLVGAAACGATVLALGTLGRGLFDRLGAQIAGACGTGDSLVAGETTESMTLPLLDLLRSAVSTIGALVLPLIAVIALAAVAAQLAQTRTPWLPRRKLEGAPSLPANRTRRAGLELFHLIVVGGVALGWLWWAAPRLAALPAVPLAAGALAVSALAAFAIAWLAIGVGDALLRHAAVGRALRMTGAEKREDDRMAAADPRWRRLARELANQTDPRAQLAEATLLILGDDAAVAIAFDPVKRPTPTRVAVGKGTKVTQLVALARRYRLPIHREPALATALVGRRGAVPEEHWPRLAELVAATRR
jgi:flagellar biosynthesis protein FlhB